MSADAVPLVLIAGGGGTVLSVVDPLPYLRDVFRRRTRPHRGSWLIWTVLAATACASQAASGGGWSVVVLATQAVTTLLVLLLSMRHGVGGVAPSEVCLLSVAGGGIAAWALFDTPVVAVLGVVLADVCGVLLMLPKTWADPWSETTSTYAIAAASGVLAALAVGRTDLALLLYPLYYCVANSIVTAVIVRRRRQVRTPAGTTSPDLVDADVVR